FRRPPPSPPPPPPQSTVAEPRPAPGAGPPRAPPPSVQTRRAALSGPVRISAILPTDPSDFSQAASLQLLPKQRQRTLQMALHRAQRHLQDVRDLCRIEVLLVPQNHHRPR